MPTIQNYPQSLLDEHSNWHMHPGNPAQGGRAIWPGQPGSGLEFLTFHRTFLVQFHAWYDTQPGADQAAVAAWTAIPPELKVDAVGWTPVWAAAENRLVSNMPPFQTADELGIFIEQGIHNQFLHSAAGLAYNEPLLFSPMTSPQSTHFYQLHGLVSYWWSQWQARQKTVIKDFKEHKEFIKDFKEHKEFIKDFKEIKEHPEKLPKEIKEKDKDIFEGGGLPGGGGDPAPLITQLSQRLDRLEAQVAAGQAFIRPEERPDVGGAAAGDEHPVN